MARRIKEAPIVHQNRIAEKALVLFAKQGIENTKMDEIAAAVGYGKATLYVYFKNKEDIVSFLALQSMEKLRSALSMAMEKEGSVKETFFELCNALVTFQEEYPTFFERSLQYIQVQKGEEKSYLGQAYKIGEEINQIVISYLQKGIASGDLKPVENYFTTIFLLWGMIAGIIKLAAEKEEYLLLAGNMTKKEFLRTGFEKIYWTISR